ncbi:MAG: efflux RND transporter periplasmic adaptor subunit [Vicinamibacterales bacterium]|nr:efflux RND transporter periplasmic adaptor subunit [Vicinamibacterales bacterium]
MKRALAVALVLSLVAAVVAYFGMDTREEAPRLLAAAVSRGSVVETVDATGTIQPVDTVQVGTQVSGTIAALGADFNDLVRRGQVVAMLDQALFQSQVDQAGATLIRLRAESERTRVQLVDAKHKHSRAERLYADLLIPQVDVESAEVVVLVAETNLAAAQAQLAQAEAALAQAKVNLSHTVIHAPVDGIVLSRNVEVGQTVSAGLQAPTLFVIARDLERLRLDARVAESDIGRVEAGQPVTFTVDAHLDDTFSGVVRQVRLEPTVVQNVVSYITVIDVPNRDGLLKPGMTATLAIEVRREDDVLRVPASALRFTPAPAVLEAYGAGVDEAPPEGGAGARRARVWVVEDSRLRAVPVRTGVTDGALVAVTSDALSEGAQVVTGTTTAPAAASTSGSPLVPAMPRRPGGGGGPQGR